MLDCSEVSIEKDSTLKDMIANYEREIKVHSKIQQELKEIIRTNEFKLKEKDKQLRESEVLIEVGRWFIRNRGLK